MSPSAALFAGFPELGRCHRQQSSTDGKELLAKGSCSRSLKAAVPYSIFIDTAMNQT